MAGLLITPGTTTYAPVGCCIYCGATSGRLSREHIIPYALGGDLVLPYASCAKCADITKKFEQVCAREVLGPARIRLKLPTRRRYERPEQLQISCIRRDGRQEEFSVASNSFPLVLPGLRLQPAGLLEGRVFEKKTPKTLTLRLLSSHEDQRRTALLAR